MADQLCTTAQVKARLGITDANDDALISELIDQVSDWIQDVTKRRLVPENAATYVVDTGAGSIIQVRRGIRVVTTLSIASSDQPDTGGVYTAVLAADILLRPSSIDRKPGWPATSILIRGSTGRLSSALNGAVIVGDFGWAATPPVIQGVTMDAVAVAYTNRKSGTSGAIGADNQAIIPWALYFSKGSPQRATIDRYSAGQGIG